MIKAVIAGMVLMGDSGKCANSDTDHDTDSHHYTDKYTYTDRRGTGLNNRTAGCAEYRKGIVLSKCI
jgi:hypothetical protein